MKRILTIIFIFIISFFFSACNPKEPTESESSELQFTVEVNYEECYFMMEYDFGKEHGNFVETGFIYTVNSKSKEKINFSTPNIHFRLIDIDKEDKRCTIDIFGTELENNIYTFRGYIKRSNGDIIYSKDQREVTIDNGRIIFTLDIKYDATTYTLIEANKNVDIKIEKSKNLDYILLTITPKDDLIFFDSIEVYLNGNKLTTKEYSFVDNVIKITIDDPNWSDVY